MQKIAYLKKELAAGNYNELLKKIYVEDRQIEYQAKRYRRALEEFRCIFGEKEVEIYSAPGRSEIGGNHTDHQHGKVLAAAVNLDAIAVVAPIEERCIYIKSQGHSRIVLPLNRLEATADERPYSRAMVKGVACKLQKEGYKIGGFEAYITGDVMSGSGVSSSASYQILIGNILSGLYNESKIDPVVLAQAGQFAENVYCNKPSGLMDQTAAAVGGLVHIDFKNPKEPVVTKVDVDFETYGHSLCVVNTGGSHANLTPDYAAIPAEMRLVAKYFGKEVLREVEEKEFYENLPAIRKETGDRAVLRAMHYFEENARVDRQAEALRNGEFQEFKRLIGESGRSSFEYLQNVYTNHDVNHQGVSLGLALSEKILQGQGVCRVHGGGFAGTIQAFVPNELVHVYRSEMEKVFGLENCYILHIRPFGGRKVL